MPFRCSSAGVQLAAIDGEVARANEERRSGRADWVAVDLAEAIMMFSEIHAAATLNLFLRDLGRTRH
jgi:hypothetical protein